MFYSIETFWQIRKDEEMVIAQLYCDGSSPYAKFHFPKIKKTEACEYVESQGFKELYIKDTWPRIAK
jgi:hypothetical protein